MKDYRKIAGKISCDYHDYPGLIGIIWIGSAVFGISDSQTDIDIRLLVNRSQKLKPMKQFNHNGIPVEVDKMDWQWLAENLAIDSDQRWIREKSVILFDPKNKITAKFKELSEFMAKQTKTQLWQYFKDTFYSHEIEKCLKRNNQETTALYFYKAVDSIIKFIFLYHNQPVPPFKWRWHFLVKDKLLPKETITNLKAILLESQPAQTKLKLLISVETQLQQMMIDKGYNPEQVKEHWRF